MSLNYDTTKCDPACRATDERRQATDAFIWSTMAVGLGTLTAKNEKEWRVRLAMWCLVDHDHGAKSFADVLALPPDEWKARHGLSCNVTNETRSAFKRRLAEYVEREAEAKVRLLAQTV